ncbi:MAG: hypothetical protein KDB29_06275, partial [Planctomycetes bacterium]|nr:hypothetical protein [Planctomycetota bacterium]
MARSTSQSQTEKLPRPTARHATPGELRTIDAKQPEDRTDFDLLKLYVKREDNTAFEALVQRHRRQVYNFVYKMVGKAEAAEDIFQETFLRVIKNAHT